MKTNSRRSPDLDLDENLSYQRNAWRVQRVAWSGFCLILVAALLGLLGPGMLSHQRKTARHDLLALEYDRFLHFQTPTYLTLDVQHAGTDETLEVWIANSYFDTTSVQIVTPEPGSVGVEQDRLSKACVDKSDVLHAAREAQGLERLDQIKYAVLERNGGITVIPKT